MAVLAMVMSTLFGMLFGGVFGADASSLAFS
jgi:hypothetical protein